MNSLSLVCSFKLIVGNHCFKLGHLVCSLWSTSANQVWHEPKRKRRPFLWGFRLHQVFFNFGMSIHICSWCHLCKDVGTKGVKRNWNFLFLTHPTESTSDVIGRAPNTAPLVGRRHHATQTAVGHCFYLHTDISSEWRVTFKLFNFLIHHLINHFF